MSKTTKPAAKKTATKKVAAPAKSQKTVVTAVKVTKPTPKPAAPVKAKAPAPHVASMPKALGAPYVAPTQVAAPVAAAPAPTPAPAAAPVAAPKAAPVAKKLTKTSEIAAHLNLLGIPATLAAPPRVFVATLTKEGAPHPISEVFSLTTHGDSTSQTVLTKLVSRLIGAPISKAEYATCSLDFLLEKEMEERNLDSLVISGENVKFLRRRDRKGADVYETLGSKTNIQIFRSNPHVIDDDKATLATNSKIAKEAIGNRLAEIASSELALQVGLGSLAIEKANVNAFGAVL